VSSFESFSQHTQKCTWSKGSAIDFVAQVQNAHFAETNTALVQKVNKKKILALKPS